MERDNLHEKSSYTMKKYNEESHKMQNWNKNDSYKNTKTTENKTQKYNKIVMNEYI